MATPTFSQETLPDYDESVKCYEAEPLLRMLEEEHLNLQFAAGGSHGKVMIVTDGDRKWAELRQSPNSPGVICIMNAGEDGYLTIINGIPIVHE